MVSVAFPAMVLNNAPNQNGVTSLTVRLRPIVLFLTDHGMSPPPPVSVTFPWTVIPFSRTVFALVAVTLPLTVMVERPSAYASTHGCPDFPTPGGPGKLGWQPRPKSEPAAAVTLRPTVIVDGTLCASNTAPAKTLRFPTMLYTPLGTTSHTPATVMLA